jgi:uncharacterized protein (TIGR03905 family)
MIYKTTGVCAREIQIEIENNCIKHVEFVGGCDGNAKGVSALVKGMEISEVMKRLSGITCGRKQTSCPDQLSKALLEITSL